MAISACGGASTQTAGEPHSRFPVQVTAATFPAHQTLAQRTILSIAVRNAGTRTIPDIAVTLLDSKYGTAAQALGTLIPPARQGQPALASRSRPVWVIDRAPGPCGYSCRQGGAGAAVTADSNTWALGRLAPGATARFEWHVTAVRAGSYTVDYQVAATPVGGPARAVRASGAGSAGSGAAGSASRGAVGGRFHVTIVTAPLIPYVTSSGRVRYTTGG
jgi:hypothetical protein